MVEAFYLDSLSRIFTTAERNNVKVVTLDLPFAYDWNYGGHLARGCSEINCLKNVTVSFEEQHSKDSFKTPIRFDVRTGTELGLSPSTIRQVFPNPDYFLDVVHLSAKGHESVANQLLPILKESL